MGVEVQEKSKGNGMNLESSRDVIEGVKKGLEKKYGGLGELFQDLRVPKKVEVFKTGSIIIDALTGVGGFPKGRVTEIFGPFSTGKTTIAIQLIAAAQKENKDIRVLFLDFEHAFDPIYAKNLGVDMNPEKFIFVQPVSLEQGWDIMDALVEKGLLDLAIIDSAAAMIPSAEMEGDSDSSTRLGLQAQLMSKFLGRMTKKINGERKCALVIMNQMRMRIDVRRPSNTREEAACGSAMKYYTSMRLELEVYNKGGIEERKKNTRDPGLEKIYSRSYVRATVVKNKVGIPFMRGNIVIDYGTGINNIVSLGDMAEERLGIGGGGGGYFKYNGKTPETTIAIRGRDLFHKELAENEALRKEIEKDIKRSYDAEQERMLRSGGLKREDEVLLKES